MMESKILHVRFAHVFKSVKHEFVRLIQSMRSGSMYGFGDSKVQIFSGSNSGFHDHIFDNFFKLTFPIKE